MAWRDSLSSLFRGEFRQAVDYAFVPQSEVNRGRQLDSALLQEVANDYAAGTITAEQMNTSISRLQENAFPDTPGLGTGGIFNQEGTSPTIGLWEGLNEGSERIQRTFSDVLGFSLKVVPWQIWIVVAVALFIYLAPILAPILLRRK